jgi:hypothetical protein
MIKAEGVGFEPTEQSPVRSMSSRVKQPIRDPLSAQAIEVRAYETAR